MRAGARTRRPRAPPARPRQPAGEDAVDAWRRAHAEWEDYASPEPVSRVVYHHVVEARARLAEVTRDEQRWHSPEELVPDCRAQTLLTNVDRLRRGMKQVGDAQVAALEHLHRTGQLFIARRRLPESDDVLRGAYRYVGASNEQVRELRARVTAVHVRHMDLTQQRGPNPWLRPVRTELAQTLR